jgi:hypothetical protein
MARGGKRTGAGRKASAVTQRTRAIAEGIMLDGNETPLEVIIKLMRNATTDEDRLKAAVAAAPYVHPRLASIEANVKVSEHEEAVKHLHATVTATMDDHDRPN